MSTDEEADRLADIAVELVCRVRDDNPAANAAWLCAITDGPSDWLRLCFVLAAAVPDDRPWVQLTAWTRPPSVGVEPSPEALVELHRAVAAQALNPRKRPKRVRADLSNRPLDNPGDDDRPKVRPQVGLDDAADEGTVAA